MSDENSENQTCKNCKYFVQHYVRFKTYFHPLDGGHCGHCCNFKLTHNKRLDLPFAEGCGRWEQADEKDRGNELQQITNAVVDMQKHLEDITSILSFIKPE